MPPQSGPVQVTDQLERRIRKPVDLLRCVVSALEIIVLAVAGVAASATTTGAQTDISDASAHLPHALIVVFPTLALFAILIIPVALAVRQIVLRQVQSLAEAVATGVLAAAAAVTGPLPRATTTKTGLWLGPWNGVASWAACRLGLPTGSISVLFCWATLVSD